VIAGRAVRCGGGTPVEDRASPLPSRLGKRPDPGRRGGVRVVRRRVSRGSGGLDPRSRWGVVEWWRSRRDGGLARCGGGSSGSAGPLPLPVEVVRAGPRPGRARGRGWPGCAAPGRLVRRQTARGRPMITAWGHGTGPQAAPGPQPPITTAPAGSRAANSGVKGTTAPGLPAEACAGRVPGVGGAGARPTCCRKAPFTQRRCMHVAFLQREAGGPGGG
jgi:hypothetical protein